MTTAEEQLANALACYNDLATAAGRKYEELRAETLAWAEIAQDLWSLCCESAMHGTNNATWEERRKRLGARLHAGLAELHADAGRAMPSDDVTGEALAATGRHAGEKTGDET